MGDFHIPDDPNWQWAYDAILYTVGEQFPKGDPSQLKALSADLHQFSANLRDGIAATRALGVGLQGNLDGPAADAFAQFQQIITQPLPEGIRRALIAGDVANQANEQIDYGQTQIVVAAFMIVLDIAMALASGFGATLVPAYINIGRKLTEALLDRLQSRLQQLSARLVIGAVDEGIEEGTENVLAQTYVIAKDNKSDGFSGSDVLDSVGAGVAVGAVASGVFLVGGRYFPRVAANTHGQAGLGAIGETLGEFAYLSMIGAAGQFNALATAISSGVGTYASRYAHDLGGAFGGGPGTPTPPGVAGPGPARDLAVTGPGSTGPGAVGSDGRAGVRPRSGDPTTGPPPPTRGPVSPTADPPTSGGTPVPKPGSEIPGSVAPAPGSTGPPSRGPAPLAPPGSTGPPSPGPAPVAPPGPQPPTVPVPRPTPPAAVVDGSRPGPGRPGDQATGGSLVRPPAGQTDLARPGPAGGNPDAGLPGFEAPPVDRSVVGSPVDTVAQIGATAGGSPSAGPPPVATSGNPAPPPAAVAAPPGQPAAGAPGQATSTGPVPPAATGSTTPAAPAATPPTAPPTTTVPATHPASPTTALPASPPPQATPPAVDLTGPPAGTTPAAPATAAPTPPGAPPAVAVPSVPAPTGQAGPDPTGPGTTGSATPPAAHPVAPAAPASTATAGPATGTPVPPGPASDATPGSTPAPTPPAPVSPVPPPPHLAPPVALSSATTPPAGDHPGGPRPGGEHAAGSPPGATPPGVAAGSSTPARDTPAEVSRPGSTSPGGQDQVARPGHRTDGDTTRPPHDRVPGPTVAAAAPSRRTDPTTAPTPGVGGRPVPPPVRPPSYPNPVEPAPQPATADADPPPPYADPASSPPPYQPRDDPGRRDHGAKAAVPPVPVRPKSYAHPGGAFGGLSPASVAKSTAETWCEADPVDVTTGRMILTGTDAALPGLPLLRTHRSDYRWGRSFGPSWASTLDQRVVVDGERVRYLAADGSILTYPLVAEGATALPTIGRALPLRRLVGGGWLLTDPTCGQVHVFAPAGRGESLLSDVTDGGLRWSFTRDDDGAVTHLRSSAGATVGVASVDGLVTALHLPSSDGTLAQAYRFDYDGDRRLVQVVNSSGDPERFGYADGRIVRWEDRNGEWYTYAYDEAGRCVDTDGRGGYLRYRFAYSDGLTVVTDSLGTERRYELNDRLQVVAVTDGRGATTRQEWDDAYRLRSRTDPLGRTTRYEYGVDGGPTVVVRPDGTRSTAHDGRVTSTTGGGTRHGYGGLGRVVVIATGGGSTTLGWTPEGDLASRVGPDGARQEWHYDGEGNLVESIDAAGRAVRFEYGPFDLPTVRIDEVGNRTEYGYDSELRLVSVTNPAGRVWRYTYDAAGRLTGETDFDGRVQRYTRDAAGQVTARTDPAGDTTHYRYDLLGRVVERRVGDVVTRLEYDARGRLAAVTNPDAVVRFERDGQGRIVAETINEQTVRTAYDGGLVRARTTPSGRSGRWSYDADGRPESLDTGGHLVRFGHDDLGREISRTVDDVAALRQTFDAAGRLAAQHVAGTAERDFSYDATGRVTAIADTLDGNRSFAADATGRIGRVVADGAERERYDYDPAGTLVATGGDRWEFAGTMLVRSDDATFTHDGKGRLVGRVDAAGAWRFTWDAEDRLVRVVTPGGHHWRYRYDGFGRRIAKQRLAADGGVVEEVRFAWSGDLLVEQQHRDAAGVTAVTSWEYRPDGSVPVTQTDDDELRTVVTDLIGTPTHLVGPDGALHWWARSDLWGRGHGPSATPLRFPGQYFDAETGLHYNRFRYYDPATARYLSPDPLGLCGGPNPVAYVSDPLTIADPLGLASCKVSQPALDPLATPAVTPDGEPSQVPTRAVPPSPEALYGTPPLMQVVTTDPDGNRTVTYQPRPSSPTTGVTADGTVQPADAWFSEAGSTPLAQTATVDGVRQQLPPLPERGSRPVGDGGRDTATRRRGRVAEDSDGTQFGPIRPVFTPAGLRMLHETDVAHQSHADSLPVGPDYKVAVEGVDGEIVAGGHAYDPDVIGGLIENDPGWNNRPITVVACDAGPLFAVDLARRLPDVPVTAAQSTVFTTGRGHAFSDDVWVTYTADSDGRVTEVVHDQTHMPGGPVPSAADIATADTHWRIATETEIAVQIGARVEGFRLELGDTIARAPGLAFKVDSQNRTIGGRTGTVMIIEVVTGPSRVESWEDAPRTSSVRDARDEALDAILRVPPGEIVALRDVLRDVPGIQFRHVGGISAGIGVGVQGGQFASPYTQWTVGLYNHTLPRFLGYAADNYSRTANQTPRQLAQSAIDLGRRVAADFRDQTGSRALPWHESRLNGHIAMTFPAIATPVVAVVQEATSGTRLLNKHFLLLAPRKEFRDMRAALPKPIRDYLVDRADHIKQLMHEHLARYDTNQVFAQTRQLFDFETNQVDYFSNPTVRSAADNALYGYRYTDGRDVPFFSLENDFGIHTTHDTVDPPQMVGAEFRYLTTRSANLAGVDRQSDELIAMVRNNTTPPPLTSTQAHRIIQGIRDQDGRIEETLRDIEHELRRDRSSNRVYATLSDLLRRAERAASRARRNESFARELREAAQATFGHNDTARRNAKTYHHNTRERTEAADRLVARIQRYLSEVPPPTGSQPPYGGDNGPGSGGYPGPSYPGSSYPSSGYTGAYGAATTSYGPVQYSSFPGMSSNPYGSYDPYIQMAFVDVAATDPTGPVPRVLDPGLGVDGRQRILDDLSALADDRADAVRDFLGRHGSHPEHATAAALWDSFVAALGPAGQADLQPVVNLYEQTHDQIVGLDPDHPLPALGTTLDDSDFLPRASVDPQSLLRDVPLTDGTHLPVIARNVHGTATDSDLADFDSRYLGWVSRVGVDGDGRTGIESALMVDEYQRSGRLLDTPPTSVPKTLDDLRRSYPGGAVTEVGTAQGLMDALGALPQGVRSQGIVAVRTGPAGTPVQVLNVTRFPSGPVVFVDRQLGGLGSVPTVGPDGAVVLIDTTDQPGVVGETTLASFRDVPPATVAKTTGQTPTAGDPVDVTTGRMILTETDAVLPGLTLERTHRSDYRWGRSFGGSWASTLDQRVVVDGDRVRYLAVDGSVLTYPLPAEGAEALPEVGRALPLRRLAGGGWLLTDPTTGRVLVFAAGDGAESLLSDVVEGELRWSVARDESGTPTGLRSTAGARVGFSSSAGLLTVLWLPNRSGTMLAAYRFGYDRERNLVDVVNSSGEATRFGYADGRIVRWDDRNGEWYTYRYDEAGRCVGTDGKGGHLRYRFAYSDGLTVVTDSLGAVRRYELNDRYQVVAETDPLGATTRSEWDDAYRLRSRTDPLGHTTTHDYDADGRLSTVTRADGSRSTITYDEWGRPSSWTDFDGSTRQRAFDDDGRVLAETDAAGEVVRFDRPVEDGPGTVTQAGPTAVVRDAARLITALTHGDTRTRFEYDNLGRVAVIEDDRGTTQVGWTLEGELAWREHPDGSVEEFSYDGEGNLVESVDAAGRRTRFEYGAFDLVTARIDDAGDRTGYTYDTELRLTGVTDPQGRTWRYTYDPNGRVTEETDFDGRTRRYVYDAAGRLVEHTDVDGQVTVFSRDALGRVVERRAGGAGRTPVPAL
ncbi:DUF6531 domain-containing protein [Micromonospora wenchangensis]|uniref:DUF6531 domain-containing protein n=1 Tax=Micromonospora wenchangensis TaxID=1185415 RepID=UPI00382FDB95